MNRRNLLTGFGVIFSYLGRGFLASAEKSHSLPLPLEYSYGGKWVMPLPKEVSYKFKTTTYFQAALLGRINESSYD